MKKKSTTTIVIKSKAQMEVQTKTKYRILFIYHLFNEPYIDESYIRGMCFNLVIYFVIQIQHKPNCFLKTVN